jgi:LL-H family phage holin
MELVNKLLQTLLEVALPILVTAAATWMIGKVVEIFKKIAQKNPDVAAYLMEICNTAVRAAEQIFGGDKGKEKKAYAIKMVEAYLAQVGIKLDLETIDAAVEAAVLEMNWEMMFHQEEPKAIGEKGGESA